MIQYISESHHVSGHWSLWRGHSQPLTQDPHPVRQTGTMPQEHSSIHNNKNNLYYLKYDCCNSVKSDEAHTRPEFKGVPVYIEHNISDKV